MNRGLNVKRRCFFLVAPLTLVATLFACGQDPETGLRNLTDEMSTLEAQLGGIAPSQRIGGCLRYASICEHAAGLCLGADTRSLRQLCFSIDERCEQTLSTYCALLPEVYDGGGPNGPDAGLPDGSWVPVDGGSAPDGWVPGDGGSMPDATYPDGSWPADLAPNDGGTPCYRGGCSLEVCSDRPDVATTCVWRDEAACYQDARCERQPDGRCDWTPTPELQQCLDNGGPTDCRTNGCSQGTTCQLCWFSYACLEPGVVC